MAISVQTIIENARILLQDTDEGGIRWVDTELIAWLNEGATEIVRIHPESHAKNVDLPLVQGTKQQVPSDGMQLLNIYRNTNGSGTPGRVIRLINMDIMNNERPSWHIDSPNPIVTRYMFDSKDPRTFYVYPPNTGAGHVSLVYSAAPTPVTQLSDTIPVMDVYAAPLTNYVCYRAWFKQVGDATAMQRASSFLELFNGAMGVKKEVEAVSDPNARGMNGAI